MKSGIKTTEFWGTGLISAVGTAAAFGLINLQQAQGLTQAIPEAVQIVDLVIDGIIRLTGLIGAIGAQFGYAKGRATIKKPPTRYLIRKP